MAFVRAARKDEIPAGTIREFQVDGKTLAISNIEGKFFAISNTCLHRGGPLGEGELKGKIVTCPWHGWQYDATTRQGGSQSRGRGRDVPRRGARRGHLGRHRLIPRAPNFYLTDNKVDS